MATSRRSFLKNLGAAFCGAVLVTLPDFAQRPPTLTAGGRFGVLGGNVITAGLRDSFADAYKYQFDQVLASFAKFKDGPAIP